MSGSQAHWITCLVVGLALLFGSYAWAQEAGEKPSIDAGDQPTASTPTESYSKTQRKKSLLAPYNPDQIPGLPDQDEITDTDTPRPGSKMGRSMPKPLPSLVDPLERRKKRYGNRYESALPPSASPESTGLDLATSRHSREGVYLVSYSSGKPNSYGLPFSWRVKIQDKNGLPIKGAYLSLRLSMPKNGHAPVITGMGVRELGNGLYKISGIRCDRAGLWHAVLEVQGRGYGDTVSFNLIVP